MVMHKRKVIVVTDGDEFARNAVEVATGKVGGRCISLSAGNPTRLTGSEIAELVMKASHDPVVVMLDDNGSKKEGYGEISLKSLASSPQIEIIGALAVASDTKTRIGTKINFSINRDGEKVDSGVDKLGCNTQGNEIFGDTVGVLSQLNIPVIVGIGDPGKMDGHDNPLNGAPITTKALREILEANS